MPSSSSSSSVEALSKRHLKELDRYVEVPQVQNSTRLSYYYGMSRQVLAQAHAFREAHDMERAYIFYKRFLRLAVDCIPEHAAYKDAGFRQDKNWIVGERRVALDALAAVNGDITAEIARHHAPAPPPPPASSSQEDELAQRLRNLRGGDAPSSTRLHSPLGGGADTLHDDFDEVTDEGTSSGITSGLLLEPSAPPLFLDDGPAVDSKSGGLSALDIDTAFQSLRLGADDDPKVTRYYPTVLSPEAPRKPAAKEAPTTAPSGQDWLSRRGMLRRLLLPTGLVGKFLQIAEPNSRKPPDGIETCGVLAGVQEGPGLVRCTTLIIPKQEGTSDTVSMTHEEELIHFCCSGTHPGGDLVQLGWIHTHPSQSCFMSSVDIHTHCGYQTMLPEAVAVVVALRNPRKPQVGVFRLTEPDGLQLIQRCELRGFHPHALPDSQIYKNHHTVLWKDSGFTVVDLR